MRRTLTAIVLVLTLTGSVFPQAPQTDIYYAAAAAGSNNGTSCANAYAYNDATNGFTNSSNWGASIGPGTTLHLCGTFTLAAGATFLTFYADGTSGNTIKVKWETGAIVQAPYFGSSTAFGIDLNGHSFLLVDGGSLGNGVFQNTLDGSINQTTASGPQTATCLGGTCTFSQTSQMLGNSTSHSSPVNNIEIRFLNMTNYSRIGSTCTPSPCDDDARVFITRTIFIAGAGSNILIHDNTVTQCATCIDVGTSSSQSNWQVYNNTIRQYHWAYFFGTSGGTLTGMQVINNDMADTDQYWDNPSNYFHTDTIFASSGNINTGASGAFADILVANNYIHGSCGHLSGGVFFSGFHYGPEFFVNNIWQCTSEDVGGCFGDTWIQTQPSSQNGGNGNLYLFNNTIDASKVCGYTNESSSSHIKKVLNLTVNTKYFTGNTQVTAENNVFYGVPAYFLDQSLGESIVTSDFNVWFYDDKTTSATPPGPGSAYSEIQAANPAHTCVPSSLTETGTTVTVTCGSGFDSSFVVNAFAVVSGVTPAGYNGTWKIVTASNPTFTYTAFASGLANSTVQGTAIIRSNYFYYFNAQCLQWTINTCPSDIAGRAAYDTHSVVGNPQLTSNDHLNTGSSAIGLGTNLTSLCSSLSIPQLCSDRSGNARPAGGAWDAGAYNFISGNPQASAPTFSPVAGTYAAAQNITVTTTSGGAIICTNTTGSPATNGAAGCTVGTLYSGPVNVPVSETLYAVAGGTGFSDSTISSAVYTITGSPSMCSACFARNVLRGGEEAY